MPNKTVTFQRGKFEPVIVELLLQPSGNCLLECRYNGAFISKYLHRMEASGIFNNEMYNHPEQVVSLSFREMAELISAGKQLKVKNPGAWDAKYGWGN